jgi:hypothetical protein
MFTKCLTITLLLTAISCYSLQSQNITGTWYFDRFGGPYGEKAQSAEILKANQQNAGISFNFSQDNKLIIVNPDGTRKTVNFTEIPAKKLLVIASDTMRIMLHTADILELYPISETKPAVFLKRTKDGKTLMSEPQ